MKTRLYATPAVKGLMVNSFLEVLITTRVNHAQLFLLTPFDWPSHKKNARRIFPDWQFKVNLIPLGTWCCCDVESSSLTLVQRRSNVVCQVGCDKVDEHFNSIIPTFDMFNYCEWRYYCYSAMTADEVRVYAMPRHRLKIALRGCMPGGVFLNSNIRNIINSYPTTHTGNPLGTRRCCDIESTSHWAHDVVVTWINVPLGTWRCCDVE